MRQTEGYDAVIVGAGAAGLSAALLLARAKHRVLVVSLPDRRNSPAHAVHSVPYAEGIRPADLYAKMESDAARYGAALVWDEVVDARTSDLGVTIVARNSGSFSGSRLLLANGLVDAVPSWLPAGTWGKSVFDCPYCHGFESDGQSFVCVGEGMDAVELALMAGQFARTMTAVVVDPDVASGAAAELVRKGGGEVLVDTVVQAEELPSGGLRLTTARRRQLVAEALLVAGVKQPERRLSGALGLERDAQGYVTTTVFGRTSNPRVWAAGVRPGSSYFLWTGAASSGLNAARSMCEDIAFGDVQWSGRCV